MLNLAAEKSLARILMMGTAFISIFVMWSVVTDPVNVTKLLALGGVSGAAITVAISFAYKEMWENHKFTILTLVLFLASLLNSVFQSTAPKSQLIYGAYGRNTGLVTYLLLVVLFISALALSQKSSFLKISHGLIAAGVINVIYSLWVIVFGDFIGWTNPYGNILGTFGNPNFIGAFLGIFASVLFAFIVQPKMNWKFRVSGILILFITFVEIKSSHAIQGIVVTAGGMALVGFYFLRSRFNTRIIPIAYSLAVTVFGAVATFGALQKGPLASLIYKNSVSLRGEYWQAAVNMGIEFPFSGVGMDTYGDWYRRLRDDQALINPGPNVITNAAHNVVLDQFAYGGWPMLISYVAILIVALIAIVKVTLRMREFNFTFVALAVGWICYQVQSIISINQIGLAIWGWLLGGAVIAYERATRGDVLTTDKPNAGVTTKKRTNSKQSVGLSPFAVGALGAVFGLIVASPPYSADTKWKSALGSGSLEKIEQALTASYLNPQGSFKYANAAQLFESNNLPDLAYKYTKMAIAFNPDSFDAWKLLYYIQKSTPEDRELAKTNLIRLDPMNKKIFDVAN